MEIVAAERSRAAAKSPIAVLMIDIDHFKTINDTLGHQAGDEVLRVVSARLRAGLRPLDAIGRYGGEEFLAVLPQTNIEGAHQAAERICHAMSKTPIQFAEYKIPVTCSIGCAASADTSLDVNTLIHQADSALYRAKSSGRNRVEIATT
jgi:diguanylate cyclase (GGDEF)-like protein